MRGSRPWLKTGEMPTRHVDAIKDHAEHLAAAYASGHVAITIPINGKLAVVVGEVRDALRLGYYRAPAAAREWLAERETDLLPVPYFPVVFALPAAIADVAFQKQAGGL
jgi:hypothetical protein